MTKKRTVLIASTAIVVTTLLTIGMAGVFRKNGSIVAANNDPYVLSMTRSINSSELSNGYAVYNTTNGNPITFNFDSSKAEVNNSGIVNLLTGGYFYNDTMISGIERINVTLSGGSATLTYGNDKDNLTAGSETLNTGGESNVPFNIVLDTPSNYFRLDVSAGPSLLKQLTVTYSCVSSGSKTPMKILFQGDSITDNSRSRTNLNDLGGGYASMVAQQLEQTYGTTYDFTFINRGHSGWNLIEDWNAGGVNHYDEEFYSYNPDIVTILIGYNDIMDSAETGVSDEEFRSCYRELLQGLSTRGIKTICMAPFFINEDSSTTYAKTEFSAKRTIVNNLAAEFGAEYIDMKPYMMQAVEDGAYKMELFGDLTHPWAAGCRIITDLVVDKISKLIDNSYATPANLGKYVGLTPTSDNDEDYTNQRAFLACSHGRVEYDNEVFYNTVDFASSKSVKMTNELLNPEDSNAYVRTLFDFHESGKMDLTSGTLKINVKPQNCVPTVSFRAFCDLSSTASSHLSTIYTVTLNNTSKAVELENGWWQVTVDLASWAHDQTNTALQNAIAIDVAMSKGENASARSTYGVIGNQNSYMWMDNLTFNLIPSGGNRGVEFVKGYTTSVTPISLTKTINIDFKFTTGSSTYLNFMLGDGWSAYYGYYRVNANGTLGGSYSGVSVSSLLDGYFRVTLVLSELTNPQGGTPTKIDLFFIHTNWTDAEGYVDFNPSYNPGAIRGVTFVKGYAADLSPISLSETINIDFKFTTGSSTYLNFMLGDGWSAYYGYYRVNANGTLGGSYSGVSVSSLLDGYFRVTLVLSELTNPQGGTPTKIDLFFIHTNWTDAEGYVDFNPSINPGALRGVVFDGGYAVNVPTIALSETIIIDFKFTSAVDTHVNFEVGQGWGNFFGYFKVNANGSLGGNYDGVTLTFLEDGYFRVTLVLSELTYINSGQNSNKPEYITLFNIRGDWTTATGYVDFNPTI